MKEKRTNQSSVKFTDQEWEFMNKLVQERGLKGVPQLLQQLVQKEMILK